MSIDTPKESLTKAYLNSTTKLVPSTSTKYDTKTSFAARSPEAKRSISFHVQSLFSVWGLVLSLTRYRASPSVRCRPLQHAPTILILRFFLVHTLHIHRTSVGYPWCLLLILRDRDPGDDGDDDGDDGDMHRVFFVCVT